MSSAVPCPYCNAQVPTDAGAAAGQRLVCPRCGEALPFQAPATSPGPVPAPPTTPVIEDTHTGWTNAAVARWILGSMLVMALVTLGFAWMTQSVRRHHDLDRPPRREAAAHMLKPLAFIEGTIVAVGLGWLALARQRRRNQPAVLPENPGKEVRRFALAIFAAMLFAAVMLGLLTWATSSGGGDPPHVELPPAPVRAVPPAELAALHYLPATTQVIIGVHVAEAMRHPAGRAFLTNYRLPRTQLDMAQIEKWTSLKLDDIDHVVLGLRLDEIPPPMVLVVQTRQPYDATRLRAALQANLPRERQQKTLYRFDPKDVGLKAVLWCADLMTVIVALKPEDLDAVPPTPLPGVSHLPAPLLTMLQERTGPDTLAWLAGHVPSWQLLEGPLGQFVPESERNLLTKVRTFGLWLQFNDRLTLNGLIGTADEPAAKLVEKYLTRKKPDDLDALRLLGPQPEFEPLGRELNRTYQLQREGATVTLHAVAGIEQKQ